MLATVPIAEPASSAPMARLSSRTDPALPVLGRRGDAIHFHPTPPGFPGHYRYELRPGAVARGNATLLRLS